MYSDAAIETMLLVQEVFRLPLRQTQGFVASLLQWRGVTLQVPNYSTLCRRRKTLQVTRDVPLNKPISDKDLHIVVDATGLKVFGEGEWKVRQHGYDKRRTWRKLHVAVDENGQFIYAATLTTNAVADCAALPELLGRIKQPIKQITADGGYDTAGCYTQIASVGAQAVIPPRHGARIWQHGNSKAERMDRDESIRQIRKVGRKQWKKAAEYHRRSLVETTFFRLKTIFGPTLRSRNLQSQETEGLIRCRALNLMTLLGMPDSKQIPATE